ncbi:MAG: glycosyltransferase [Geodermatophilaceae bacterium]|nr:glycosyltransferase [Geodermatophilaceae bacterium]
MDGIEPGFLLSVGRDRGYKNVRTVVAAMEHLPHQRLVTVGSTGPPHSVGNVQHLGMVTDEELRWLYASARAVVSAAYEDFGLSPHEGFSFGTPAVLLRAGGFLDTMVEGLTGVFFERAEPWAIAATIRQLPAVPDKAAIMAHAENFSDEVFQARMRAVIAEVLA